MANTGMSNCSYNTHKQLVKRLQFLYHADKYLQQAKEDRHAQCEAMWGQIVKNEKESVKLLQEAVKRDRANEKM